MLNKLGHNNVLVKFTSAQIVANFLRLLSGFFIIKFISPEFYGQFTSVAIYVGYIMLGHGGILNGLSRELPYQLGKDNDAYARQLASSTYVLSVVICFIAALIFFVLGILKINQGETLFAIIYFSYVVIGGLSLLNKQFLPILYRTNKDFNSLAKQNIYLGLVNILTVLLVYFFSVYGLILRGILLAIVEFTLLFKNKPYKLSFAYHIEHFNSLFKTGLPIFTIGQVEPVWYIIANTFLVSVGGFLNYGLYALSLIILGALGIIPVSLSQIIYPKMSIMLGKGESVHKILKTFLKPVSIQFIVLLFICTIVAYVLPDLVHIFLPKYKGGIVAAQWICFVPIFKSFSPLNNIYNVVKMQKWYLFSLVIGAAVGLAFVVTAVNLYSFKLHFFSQGILLGTAIQQILSLFFLFKLSKIK